MALPYRTTGSLCPAFASARLVSLAVKHAFAIALSARFPTVPSVPSSSSVTLWEETAPVKLPTMHCPRPAIPAGRTFPDKEFRYLRTVIVTAAVYRGFNQELAPHHLTFRHRAGVTPYTSTFVLAECCVFNKQSQPPIFCNPIGLQLYAFTY